MAIEDAIVQAETLGSATSLTEALTTFQHRRRAGTDWVGEQTRRRDRARALHPIVRNLLLKRFGARIQGANYRPLRDLP